MPAAAAPRLFLDLDGVLADFNRHYHDCFGVWPDAALDNVNWLAVAGWEDFYLGIPPMPDYQVLWQWSLPHSPSILTGIPHSVERQATANKRAWVERWLHPMPPVFTCRSRDKARYCSPGDILVDDRERYRPLWEAAGGIWITHRSAAESVAALSLLLG